MLKISILCEIWQYWRGRFESKHETVQIFDGSNKNFRDGSFVQERREMKAQEFFNV